MAGILVILGWIIMFVTSLSTIGGIIQLFSDFTILEILTNPSYQMIASLVGIAAAACIAIRNAIIKSNLEACFPRFVLLGYGVEVKRWNNSSTSLVAYISVSNKPKSISENSIAKNVRARVEWSEDIPINCGRWFFSNRERRFIKDIQSIEIKPNGETQKLHFAFLEPSDQMLYAIWNNKNDDIEVCKSESREPKYKVKITLTDSKGAKNSFWFMVSVGKESNDTCLEIVEINKKGKEIGETEREYLSETEKYGSRYMTLLNTI